MSAAVLTEAQVQDVAATIACLLAGRCDGRQAVATVVAQMERILTTHTSSARLEVRIKAEALREAASDIIADCTNQAGPCICASGPWLHNRAAELEAGGAQ